MTLSIWIWNRISFAHLASISQLTRLFGKCDFMCETRQSALTMSPSDPINMIRIEGEVNLFSCVGLVWSLVNSKYIHINEFGNRNVECPQGQHPIIYNLLVYASRTISTKSGWSKKDTCQRWIGQVAVKTDRSDKTEIKKCHQNIPAISRLAKRAPQRLKLWTYFFVNP